MLITSDDRSAGLAAFWQSVLGWRRAFEQDDEIVLDPPEGSPDDGIVPDLLLARTSGGKAGKNRLHLDLRPENQAAGVHCYDVRTDDGHLIRAAYV